MRSRCIILLVAVIIALAAGSTETLAEVSDAAVLFLRLPIGARAAGMGEAFVAVADDATATYWNPAGLGMYPLASEYHEYSLTNDQMIRNKAVAILKGNVSKDYSETVGEFLLNADGILRQSKGEEERYAEYEVEPNISVSQFIAAHSRMEDRELLKICVRSIALENTGVSHTEILDLRENLLRYADKEKVGEINSMFENMLMDWHNLRITAESFAALPGQVDKMVEDGSLSDSDYAAVKTSIQSLAQNVRPESIRIPYAVLVAIWKDYRLPWESKIEDIALLNNDVPSTNFTKYDVWAITSSGLLRYDAEMGWQSNMEVIPGKGQLLDDVITLYASVSDEAEREEMKRKVLMLNFGIERSKVEEMIAKIRSAFPEDEEPSEMFEFDLTSLLDWYDRMTLSIERFANLMTMYDDAVSDDSLSSSELERLEFAVHAVSAKRLPAVVYIPYSLVFTSRPTCIAATDRLLWVGTSNGLYLFNGRAWQKFDTDSYLPSNRINDLSVYDGDRMWVATGKGVAHYYRGNWTVYDGGDNGLTNKEFTAVYGYSRDRAWAAADDELWFFNGNAWRSDYSYTANVNDSLTRVVREFTGVLDQEYIDKMAQQLKNINGLSSMEPEPGTNLKIPFRMAFRHPITSMAYANFNNQLWVGTTHGLKVMADGKFRVFGWKPFTASKDITLKEAALESNPELSKQQADKIAGLMRSYNKLSSDSLAQGQSVYIYSNHLGSRINSIVISGDDLYIGTALGTIVYDGERFDRFYRNDLESEETVRILTQGGDSWFATPRKVVVYAHSRNEISLMHSPYAPELAKDLYFEGISKTFHLGDEWGTLGLQATFMSYGTIPQTGERSAEILGEFHAFDSALELAYGTSVSSSFSFGLGAKIIYSRLSTQGAGAEKGSGTATAFAVDAGILYRTPVDKLTLGAAVTNLGPNIAYIDAAQSDPLPRNLAVGLAYDLLKNPYNTFTVIGELNKSITNLNDGISEELKDVIQSIGFEYEYGSLIALRAGYKYDPTPLEPLKYPTVGAGLMYNSIRFDFAYIPSSEGVRLSNTLRVSLTAGL
jgi:hypothetical protein